MKEEKSKRGIVLVASHNTSFRWTFIKALFKHKFDVSEAGDGNVVCNMLEDKKDEWYRCLVLDLDISVMGGLGVIDYLRQILKSKIPIIVTHSQEKYHEIDNHLFGNAMDLGASAMLKEPSQLKDALRACTVYNDAPTMTHMADVALALIKKEIKREGVAMDPRKSLLLVKAKPVEVMPQV